MTRARRTTTVTRVTIRTRDRRESLVAGERGDDVQHVPVTGPERATGPDCLLSKEQLTTRAAALQPAGPVSLVTNALFFPA